MRTRKLLIIGAMVFLSACIKAETPVVTEQPKKSEMNETAAQTNSRLYPTSNVPGFSVPALEISVKGEQVLLFEYASIKATEAEMARISADGKIVGAAELEWAGPVHFFATGKQIAVYVGSKSETIQLLLQEGGQQFAGDPLE